MHSEIDFARVIASWSRGSAVARISSSNEDHRVGQGRAGGADPLGPARLLRQPPPTKTSRPLSRLRVSPVDPDSEVPQPAGSHQPGPSRRTSHLEA